MLATDTKEDRPMTVFLVALGSHLITLRSA
jgi:hypothetical protein